MEVEVAVAAGAFIMSTRIRRNHNVVKEREQLDVFQ